MLLLSAVFVSFCIRTVSQFCCSVQFFCYCFLPTLGLPLDNELLWKTLFIIQVGVNVRVDVFEHDFCVDWSLYGNCGWCCSMCVCFTFFYLFSFHFTNWARTAGIRIFCWCHLDLFREVSHLAGQTLNLRMQTTGKLRKSTFLAEMLLFQQISHIYNDLNIQIASKFGVRYFF